MDMEEKRSEQTPEHPSEQQRPDPSQLNAVEKVYENFRGINLKHLDIFIGCCIAALVLVVLIGALRGNGIL